MCVFSMKHISCCKPVDSGPSQGEILLMPSSQQNWNIPGFPKSPDCQGGQPSLMVQHGDSDTTLFLSASIRQDHFFQVAAGSKPERNRTRFLAKLKRSMFHSLLISHPSSPSPCQCLSSISHGQKPRASPRGFSKGAVRFGLEQTQQALGHLVQCARV